MPVNVVSDKPVKTIRVTCTKCYYELEYTPIDVCSNTDSDGDSWYWIVCPRPECKEHVTVRGRYI